MPKRVVFAQALRVDQGLRFRQGRREVVMIGDNYVYACAFSLPHGLVGRDARIARQDDPGALLDVAFEVFPVYPVGFGLAVGDVIARIRAELAQRFDEEGGRGLPVYVKVAPDQNLFTPLDGRLDPTYAFLQVRERLRRGRVVGTWVQEGTRLLRGTGAPLGQKPRHKGIPAYEAGELFQDGFGRRVGPLCHRKRGLL